MAMKISSGRQCRAQKVVIYGPEGIGKTTLASQFPDPLFLDLESGSDHLDVRRIENVSDWKRLKQVTGELLMDPSVCRTLVIDTADKAETWASLYVCRTKGTTSIEDFPYGKGYTFLAEEFDRLLDCLNDVLSVGINVVFTAHGKMRKFERPGDSGTFDRWELNLNKNVAPILKQWADMILFLNFQSVEAEPDNASGKVKDSGRERLIYTTHQDCWDAKNRHGLADILPLEYNSIRSCFDFPKKDPSAGKVVPKTKKVPNRDRLAGLMKKDNLTALQIQKVVESRGRAEKETPMADYDDKVVAWILKYWDRIKEMAKAA